MLFQNINRVDLRPGEWGEHPYEYLELSARPEADDIRMFLEQAWEHYPDSEKKGMLTRIKDTKIVNYKSAIFELILHELLIKRGCIPTIHPTMPHSEKKPDFFVETKDGSKFYLEAVLALEYDDKQSSFERERKKLIDKINRHFAGIKKKTLGISIIHQTKTTVAERRLFDEIRQKINNLNSNSLKWIWQDEKSG